MKPTYAQVLRQCLALLETPCGESVPRHLALGRILAQDITSDRDYPAADLSMMDGYAIASDERESYPIDGDNLPGSGPGTPLREGSARRIFTGAELPAGAKRILPKEVVHIEAEAIRVQEWPASVYIRPRAQEAQRGDVVLNAGSVLGAVELSILAGMGCRDVSVFERPSVGHLVTGDEIVSADLPLSEGKLRDSNSDLIAAFLAAHGGFEISRHERVSDDRELLFQRVREMAAACDVVLISGGASVGDHDHARAALEAAGFAFIAHRLNLRPGGPAGVARCGKKWAFALPGNPLSHLVVLRLLVVPLLQACAGGKNVEPQLLRGILDGSLPDEPVGRETFWPAKAALRSGNVHLRPGRFLSSGDLIGVAGMNTLIHLPAEKPVPAVNDPVYFLPLAPTFA
jgi:molybdopterin molybdotransferase